MFELEYNQGLHTHMHTHSPVCPQKKLMNSEQQKSNEHPYCTKLWPPSVISCWKELVLLREIVNYRSRARNEQGESTISCHNYKAGKWSSVLSKDPTWNVSPGQGLDNWASVKMNPFIVILNTNKSPLIDFFKNNFFTFGLLGLWCHAGFL